MWIFKPLRMTGVAVSYIVLCAFVLLTGARVLCPQEAQVSEMCIPSVRTGSRVLIDMSTATEEIQNCKCTFTTTANTVKFMTYSTPGYPNCGTAIDIQTDSGTNTTFECLMSGSLLDTTDNKNGSITLEQIATPFDKNYCLILEHAGNPRDSVTVTCINKAAKTDGVSATPTSPAVTNAALTTAQARQSTINSIFSVPDPPSNRKMAILIDEPVPSNDTEVHLNTFSEPDMTMQGGLSKAKHTPTEKVTGAILFQGNMNDSKQKQYQSINLINTTGRNVSSDTLNTVLENPFDVTPKELSTDANTSDFIAETNQIEVKTETVSVASMSLPNSKVAFNGESINTNVNATTELPSNNYTIAANISDNLYTENNNVTVNKPIPELVVKADIVTPKELLKNNIKTFSTGLSGILSGLSANDNQGSSGILLLSDRNKIQAKDISKEHASDRLIGDQNKTDTETVMDNSNILSVPIVSMTDNSNTPIQNLSVDSIPFVPVKENHSLVKEVSGQMDALDTSTINQEISPSRIESGTVVFNKNTTSYMPSSVDVRTIRFDDKQPEESARTAAAADSIMSTIKNHMSIPTNNSLISLITPPIASAEVNATTTKNIGPTADHEINKITSPKTETVDTVAEIISIKMTTLSPATLGDSASLGVTQEALRTELNVRPSIHEQSTTAINSEISDVSTRKTTSQSALDIPAARNMTLATYLSAVDEPAAASDVDIQTAPQVFVSSTGKSVTTSASSADRYEAPFASLSNKPTAPFASSTSEQMTPFSSSTNKPMAPFVSSTDKAAQYPSIMEPVTDSSIVKSEDFIPLADSAVKLPKLESSPMATSAVSVANLPELSITETTITPIDEQIFFKIVKLLRVLSQERKVKALSVSEMTENQSNYPLPNTTPLPGLSVGDFGGQSTTEVKHTLEKGIMATSEILRQDSVNVQSPGKDTSVKESEIDSGTITSAPIKSEILRQDSVNIQSPGKDTSVKESEIDSGTITSAPITAKINVAQAGSIETTEQTSSLIERPLDTNIISQTIKDNSTEPDGNFKRKPVQIDETITEKAPTFIQTTKKAYSVVVDSVQDKHSKTEVKGDRVNKSSAKQDDDPSLFGIDRTVLIIILACVGGAVLVLIIMALVVNRRRKKRTASAPITNHKFTVDNIIYDNGCAEDDPEKGNSSPIHTSNIEENVQQPSTSNGIEVRTH